MIVIALLFSNIFYLVLKVKHLKLSENLDGSFQGGSGKWSLVWCVWGESGDKMGPEKFCTKKENGLNCCNAERTMHQRWCFSSAWGLVFLWRQWKISGSVQLVRPDLAHVVDGDPPRLLLPHTLHLPRTLLCCFQVPTNMWRLLESQVVLTFLLHCKDSC